MQVKGLESSIKPYIEINSVTPNIFETFGKKDILFRLWGNAPCVNELSIQASEAGLYAIVINEALQYDTTSGQSPTNQLQITTNAKNPKTGSIDVQKSGANTSPYKEDELEELDMTTRYRIKVYLERKFREAQQTGLLPMLVVDYRRNGENNKVTRVERFIEDIDAITFENLMKAFLEEVKKTEKILREKNISQEEIFRISEQIRIIEEWLTLTDFLERENGTILVSPDISLIYPFPNSFGGIEQDLYRAVEGITKDKTLLQQTYTKILAALREATPQDQARYNYLFRLVQETVITWHPTSFVNTVIICPHTTRGVIIHNAYSENIQKK